MILCKHWIDCGLENRGCCAIEEYENPSIGVCLKLCTAYVGPSRGAGDLLTKAIKTATLGQVGPCGGCNKRKMKLNGVLPFLPGTADR